MCFLLHFYQKKLEGAKSAWQMNVCRFIFCFPSEEIEFCLLPFELDYVAASKDSKGHPSAG